MPLQNSQFNWMIQNMVSVGAECDKIQIRKR